MKELISMAIEIAEKGKGKTEHRPLVGCIVLRKGVAIATGFHGERGRKHAEAIALEKAGKRARGGEMFVTLEPCSFRGRTGACTEKIIKNGIRKVIIGTIDPNPKARGKGIARLVKAGIKVELLNSGEAKKLNQAYNKWISTGKPFVLLKVAMSADGFISFGSDRRKKISCGESRKKVQELRNEFEAIMAGIGTVEKDNPRLTCRMPRGRNPVRIVLDSELGIPKKAKLLQQKGKTIIFYRRGLRSARKKALGRKAELVAVRGKGEMLDLREVLRVLGGKKIMSVLVEGGQKINTSFLREGLADRAVFFVSPKEFGKGLALCSADFRGGIALKNASVERRGKDLVLGGQPKRIN